MQRREFIKRIAQTSAAVSALSAQRVLGANERVGIGVIGFGLMGRIHTRSFQNLPNAQVVAIAEAYRPRLEAGGQLAGGGAKLYSDFRKLLDDKSVDAVVVATPDHWHALMTMMACAAGKDVYVEKPLTLFVREGRWMLDAARRHKRVVQVGTQQRSASHYARARDLISSGALGRVVSVQVTSFRNVTPGFGNPPDQAPPSELDYAMWLGPAPERPYNPNRAIYHFRWFWDYSGGQMTNLGHHSIDIAHWALPDRRPKAVFSAGGRFTLRDNCEVPDVQDTIVEYPDFHLVSQIRECAAAATAQNTPSLVFHGTKGTLLISRDGFEIVPDKKELPGNIVARIMGGHPVGGPQADPSQKPQLWTEAVKDQSGDRANQVIEHARNFLECVKSRQQPKSDLASAHEVSTVCHLANISLRLGRRIRWDGDKEDVIGDTEASAMLTRTYRSPWEAELKALI